MSSGNRKLEDCSEFRQFDWVDGLLASLGEREKRFYALGVLRTLFASATALELAFEKGGGHMVNVDDVLDGMIDSVPLLLSERPDIVEDLRRNEWKFRRKTTPTPSKG